MPLADRSVLLKPLADLLNRTWPGNRTVNIVCHGHSVPAGYLRTPHVDPFASYPHLLHRALKERHPFAVLNVIVTAIGGENSRQGAARFAADALTHRPDLVTIDYGLNDRGLPVAEVDAAWRRMVGEATAAGVPAVLLTPTFDAGEVDPADPERGAVVDRARHIRELAADLGTGLADAHASWASVCRAEGGYARLLSQSNHPSRAGHGLIAERLVEWFPL